MTLLCGVRGLGQEPDLLPRRPHTGQDQACTATARSAVAGFHERSGATAGLATRHRGGSPVGRLRELAPGQRRP